VKSLVAAFKSCPTNVAKRFQTCLDSSPQLFHHFGVCELIKVSRKACDPLRKLNLCMPLAEITTGSVKLFVIKNDLDLHVFLKEFNPI
jgi:hypothetical protein